MRVDRKDSVTRSRWAAIGAAVAVTVGSGGLMSASATLDTGERAVFVPITPCRVMDTRGAPSTVGSRNTPLGPGETHTITVLGVNGNCTIPADAVGLSMNVTAVNPTSPSFLSVFPFGAQRPTASNLNWVAGQAPVPNAVTADIGTDGKVSFFNLGGTVDVAADIVGYYVDHTHDDRYYTETEVDAMRPLFAQVNAGGTLANSSGGVTSLRISAGQYEVDFGRDISLCAFVATQGEAGVGFGPATGILGATDRAGKPSAVFAASRDFAGAFADRSFQLIVVC